VVDDELAMLFRNLYSRQNIEFLKDFFGNFTLSVYVNAGKISLNIKKCFFLIINTLQNPHTTNPTLSHTHTLQNKLEQPHPK
jgi:hypothetical protein